MRWITTTLVVAVWLLGSVAVADPPEAVVFSYVDEANGNAFLLANPIPDGSWGQMTWQACPPGGGCADVTPDSTNDRILHVGNVPSGTVFLATASDGQQSVSATSDPYNGPLRVEQPPRVAGSLRVGHVIRPLPAVWSGGWGGEQPFLQLQVCRTSRAASCKVIASTFYWDRCPGTGARIAKRYLGWFVRVADNRSGRGINLVFPNFAVLRPEDLTPLTASANTAVQSVGRVRSGHGPKSGC